MTNFNKTQINKLTKLAHSQLYTSYFLDFKRATSIRINDLVADIYEEATGESIDRNWSCATCTYNAYKRIGRLYFLSMDALNISYDEHGQI